MSQNDKLFLLNAYAESGNHVIIINGRVEIKKEKKIL